MNHYPHHIGDFDRATRHLTRLERSVYRDMLDMYYDTESRLPLDVPTICRKIIARSNDESTAVEQVLNEFFEKTDSGYWHERCEIEIETYRNNASQKALAGKASAAKRAAAKELALNGKATAVERPLDSVTTGGNGASTNQNQNQNSLPNGKEVSANASASQPLKPKKEKPAKTAKPVSDEPTAGSLAWAAYADAYKARYGVEPIRNAKTNSLFAQLVAKVGDTAPAVARWYVERESTPFYVTRNHPVDVLLRDAEGLHTRMQLRAPGQAANGRAAKYDPSDYVNNRGNADEPVTDRREKVIDGEFVAG